MSAYPVLLRDPLPPRFPRAPRGSRPARVWTVPPATGCLALQARLVVALAERDAAQARAARLDTALAGAERECQVLRQELAERGAP